MHSVDQAFPMDLSGLGCLYPGFVDIFNLSVGLGPEGCYLVILQCLTPQVLRKPFHVKWRTIVRFGYLRISIGAKCSVHNLDNLFCRGGAYNLMDGKARVLVGNDHEILTGRKRAVKIIAERPLGRTDILRCYARCLLVLA